MRCLSRLLPGKSVALLLYYYKLTLMIAIRFQEAAQVVNGILVDKFPLLLNRIIQKLHLKVISLYASYSLFNMC